jgi:hypothetical protein
MVDKMGMRARVVFVNRHEERGHLENLGMDGG